MIWRFCDVTVCILFEISTVTFYIYITYKYSKAPMEGTLQIDYLIKEYNINYIRINQLMSTSEPLFTAQMLSGLLTAQQSVDNKKAVASVCHAALHKGTPEAHVEQYVKFIFKLSLLKNNQTLFDFVLFRVPWFQYPYIKFITHLEKAIRYYRGKGKQATSVGYNILAQGLVTCTQRQTLIDTICRLLQGRYDNEILINSLRENYPHKNRSVEAHQNYIEGLLLLCRKNVHLRGSILEIIVENLSTIDTEIKIGDEALTQPYIKESEFLEKRLSGSDYMGNKLDRLLSILLEFVEHCDETLAKELLVIFHNKVLITDKNKYIQYIMFYISEKNKKVCGYFLSLLLDNILQTKQHTYRQAYFNNIFYLSSYLVRSKNCSTRRLESCMKDILNFIQLSLLSKNHIQGYSSVDLHQNFQENQHCLYLLQLVIYVFTYKTSVLQNLRPHLEQILAQAQKTIYFQIYMHPEIFKNYTRNQADKFSQDRQILRFQNKFIPVLLPLLGQKIDPTYQSYKLEDIVVEQFSGRKRKASTFLEKSCQKKIKTLEKQSQHSQESTCFLRI